MRVLAANGARQRTVCGINGRPGVLAMVGLKDIAGAIQRRPKTTASLALAVSSRLRVVKIWYKIAACMHGLSGANALEHVVASRIDTVRWTRETTKMERLVPHRNCTKSRAATLNRQWAAMIRLAN